MSGPCKWLEVEGYSKITRDLSRRVELNLFPPLETKHGYQLKIRFTPRTVKVRYWTLNHRPLYFYGKDRRRTDGLPLALGIYAAIGWRTHLGLEPLLDYCQEVFPEIGPVIGDWLNTRENS